MYYKVVNTCSVRSKGKILVALLAIVLSSFFPVHSYGQPDIIYAEWYINNDPGLGLGTSIPLTPSANLQGLSINIDPATLSSGVHQFTVRAKDANGNWGLNQRWLFFKSYNSSTASGLPNITLAEWFLDNDPGFGNGTSIPITASSDLNGLMVNIDPATLSSGVHQFTVRAKDADGNWSLNQRWLFFKSYNSSTASGLPNITLAEWFLDNDPGFGNGTSIPITASSDLNGLMVNIDPATLSSGVHQFTVRAKDANGNWSLNQRWIFIKSYSDTSAINIPPNLNYVEYYIETDPGLGRGTQVNITPANDINNLTIPVDISGLPIGNYGLFVRAKDVKGNWSLVNKLTFKVESLIATHIITGNLRDSLCAGGPIDIPFIVDTSYGINNFFTAQLSDSSGSFTNPVNIGTLTGYASDTIHAIIPAATLKGNNYRIRVISSSPAITSAPNTTAIIISRAPATNFTITGNTNVLPGVQAYSASVAEPGVIWKWQVSGGGTINASGATATITWTTPGNYIITLSDSNNCGNGLVRTLNVTVGNNSLVAYYPFNGAATDMSGNGNNGIVHGAVLTTDRFGNANSAYSFNGTGDYIECPSLPALNNAAGLSISLWIKTLGLNNTGNIQFIVSRGWDQVNGHFKIAQTDVPASSVFWASVNSTFQTGTGCNSASAFQIPHSQWHHVVLSYDKIAISLYVDDVLSCQTPYTANLAVNTDPVLIGKHITSGYPYFTKGLIDDIAFYNYALSQSQVDSLYGSNNGVAPTIAPVLSAAGRTLKASSLPIGANGYHWFKNGTLIAGIMDSLYNAQAAGIYTVKFFNVMGEGPVSNSIEFTNDAGAQTISFPAIPDKTYGDAAFRLTATASSGLPVAYRVVSGPVSISGDTVLINGAGAAVIEATQPGNLNYQAAAAVTQSLTINKATATIVLSNLNRVYDGSPKIPTAVTNPAGLPVNYLFNGTSASSVNAGTYYVAASINNANYTGTTTDTLRIEKASQQIILTPIPDKEYGTAPFNVQATSSSSLPVQLSIQANPANCATLSGNTITINTIGTVVINAMQPGNANYNGAAGMADTFNIIKANQQISIVPIPEITIDSISVPVNATVNTGLPLTYSIITNPATGIASLAGNVITFLGDTGTVVIKVAQAGNQFYNAAEAQRSFKVLGLNQFITFSSIPNKIFGDAPFDLNANASSALPVHYNIVSGAAFFSGNVLTITGAGTITVEASQPGNSSFRAAIPVRQSFTVGKAAQTITIDTIVNKTYGDAPFAVTALAGSGLPVNFTILSGYAYIYGNTIVITGAGNVTVSALQNGNQNYLSATAQRTFCVAPTKPQKISGFTQSCISTQLYAIDTIAGTTYTWTVSGGGTLLTSSGSKISVSWNTTGTHELFVKANNTCNSAANDTIGLMVQVIDLPIPPEVTNLFPVNGTVVTDFPISLSWQASGISQVYDVYIWPEASAQPATPFAANLQAVAAVIYNGSQLPNFAPGVRYNWKVVTKNACKQSDGVTGYFMISKLPNLVLQSVQAADTVFSGNAIDITVKVLNNGGVSTRNTHWTDAVYLSRDTILNTQVDTYIGGAGNLSSLDSGQQYMNTLHVALPRNTIGNYHLIVVTNAYNSLTEATRLDDTIRRPILINLTPPPDLQIAVVATPGDAFSAQFIPVTYTVKNKGTGEAKSSKWLDYIYISPDPVFNRTTAVKIGENEKINYQLLPDSAYTNTVSVLLPARFFGTYYIFAETDVKDSVYEFTFENNNTNRNDSIQIFLTPPPDFVVTQADIPASISSQEIITIDYRVKNIGATAPPTPDRKWLDGIYISRDSVFNLSKARLLDYTIPYTRFLVGICLNSGGGGGGSSGGTGSVGGSLLGGISYSGTFTNNIQYYCNAPASLNVKYYTGTNITSNNDTLYHIGDNCPGFSYHPLMLPDETYQTRMSAMLPDSLEGTYYLHVHTDFSNTVFEFQQENNNTKGSKVQILNPDLVVNTITLADTVNSGTNLPLSWVIKNGGHGKVFDKNRKDLIWLSVSPVYNPANMTRLDSLIYCTAMDTGTTITKEKTIRIPDGLSGNYYLFIEVDKDNAIYEGNHETNNYLSELIIIKLSPWPDLKMNTVQLSKDSAEFDEDFMLTYNVSNKGIAPILGKTWKDIIYVSRSSVLDTVHGYRAGEVFRAQSLDTNASYTVNQTMRIDGSTMSSVGIDSNYYVYVFTDGNREIYEHTAENNNLGRSNKLFVRTMDLAVTTVNGSLNVFSGQNTSVSWQVLNKGGKSDISSIIWYDKVYLSADTVLDAGDADLAALYINGPLLSNDTYSRTINYQVPNGISGNYYLLVKTDYSNYTRDINRNNNVNTIRYANGAPKPISVTLTPSPDLMVAALASPSVGYTGQPITVKWQVKNGGIGPTLTGSWKEKIYLTTSPNPQQNISVTGTPIGTYTRSGNLAVDSSYADSLRVFVPAILSGNYYLYFATDFPSQVYEHNAEDNNIALRQIFIIRPQPSDLVVSAITHPSQALAGDTFTVSWKVKNRGINPAEGYFTQGVYLSKDAAWSVDDALVSNSEATIYISPSDEKLFSKSIRTTGARDGGYFVVVRTDLTNNIVETDDNNNTGISTDSITVSVLNLPQNTVTPHPLLSKAELYYKLVIPDSLEGETVLVSLRSYLLVTPNELYIKFGDIPSRSGFDYGYQSANSSNQDIVIPAASKGTYYLLVYNNGDTNQNNITLLAQRISFSIISVHTNEGGNTGLVTVKIGGAKFEPGMQVSLQNSTLGTIVANSVQYVNSTTVFATFNLAGRSMGQYNLVARKLNDITTSLPNGFRILQGSGGGFQGGGTTSGGFYCTIGNIGVDELVNINIQNPEQVRFGQSFSMNINFGNSGNVDVPLPGRLLISMSGAPVSLTQEGLAEGKKELYLEFKELNGPVGILRPGATGSVTIYARGIFSGNQTYRLIE